MGKRVDCNDNCFECKFVDCIVSTSQKERERNRLRYQKHKEEKKIYNRGYYQKQKGEIKNVN